jgi:hypothetical protein
MKKLVIKALCFYCLFTISACEKDEENKPKAEETGFIKGVVTDTQGRPMAGAEITIDNTLFYNSNLITTTDSKGEYKVKLSGSFTWKGYGQIQKSYNEKIYTLDLHPQNPEGFTSEGGVRNFQWQLKGKRPGSESTGYYGGTITFDNFPGVYEVDRKAIEFTLTPVGPLIDGSAGQTLKIKSSDGFNLYDVPIGRYTLSASFNGSALKLRRWNTTDAFVTSLQVDFQPQIAQQCNNCIKLEYNK